MGRWSYRRKGRLADKDSGRPGRKQAEEEISLARVILGKADSLTPPSSLDGDEADRLLSTWRSAPLGRIRLLNKAMGLWNGASWTHDSEEKARALAATEALLGLYYEAVIEDLERSPASVQFPPFAIEDDRVAVALYLKEGMRLARRLALRYQLCLHDAGVSSCMVEGTLQHAGTRVQHAWNLAWFDGHVALVDVALPGIDAPLVIVGVTLQELYREALRFHRLYVPADSLDSCPIAIGAAGAESTSDPAAGRAGTGYA